MMHSVIAGVLGFALEFLFSLLWWIVLFPVVWLVSLAFILVIALFQQGRYRFAVTDGLAAVHDYWKEWGLMVVP